MTGIVSETDLQAQEAHALRGRTLISLRDIAKQFGINLAEGSYVDSPLTGGAALRTAGATEFAYMDHARYVEELQQTRAGACFVSPRYEKHVPPGTVALVVRQPYVAFAELLAQFHPEALRPSAIFSVGEISPRATIHPTALLGDQRCYRSGRRHRSRGSHWRWKRHRSERSDRTRGRYWHQCLHRSSRFRYGCRHRQQRHHPSRCSDRPGWLWVRSLRARPP